MATACFPIYHDSDNNDYIYGPFSNHHIPAGLMHDIDTAADFDGPNFQVGANNDYSELDFNLPI